MPRKRGMIGPGAGAMGGPGMKPARPPTAAAGRPPPIRPPGATPMAKPIASAPGPSPGLGGGGMGGPPKGGGIGGSPGFKRGGEAHEEKEEKAFRKGGNVTRYEKGGDVKGRTGRDTASASKSC